MAVCSQRPRCHKTKKRKCIKPNPWLSYLSQNGGKGLSRAELMHGYSAWKSATFRRFNSSSKAHVARRQEKLCDMFAPKSRPARPGVATPPRRRPAPTVNRRVNQKKAREERMATRTKQQAEERRERAYVERREAAAVKKRMIAEGLRSTRLQARLTRREAANKKREEERRSEERKRKLSGNAEGLRAAARARNNTRLTRREAANKKREEERRSEERKREAANKKREEKRRSEERKRKLSGNAEGLRAAARARNNTRLTRREAANKKREEERRSEERKRKLSGKGKSKSYQQPGEALSTERRKVVEGLRERFCKGSFKSPIVARLGKISHKTVLLQGKLTPNTFKPYPPKYAALPAYRLSPPMDGTCMWMSIAAGLLGSPGQWKSIERGGESLCDRLMIWLQQYQSEGKRRGFDFGFVKWIFLTYLRKMPLSEEKKDLLDTYNAQDEDSEGKPINNKVDVEEWSTKKEFYDEIMNLYATEVMKFDYWGGPTEIRLLSKALYPLVDFGVFILPNNNEIKGKHLHYFPKEREWRTVPGPTITEPRMQFSVYSRPKPASVLLLLNDNRRFHYELLSLHKRRKDFLVLENDVPEYMFLPHEK